MGGTVGEHASAVECIDADAVESRRTRKQVDGQVIGAARLRVAPLGELWIISQE